MGRSRTLEAMTAELNQIRQEPTSEAGLASLRRAISSKYGIIIARAAKIIAEFEIYSLIPDLVQAFERCMVKPIDRDPGCRAKAAIADTLYRLEFSDETLFLKGVRHVQLEPVWGGQVDTASKLRGLSALGLVRMNYPDVMIELADLLADSEAEARIGAARAIAYSENPFGVALLRFRLKVGDTPTVLGECLLGLLKLAPTESLKLAQSFLEAGRKVSDHHEALEMAEVTALALGESRLVEALDLLRDWWQRTTHRELKKIALLAIATLRQDPAKQFLLDLAENGSEQDAEDAVQALGLWQRS
ncbi:hypothetical protein PN498_01135 [Oscillatoria sp. CS-180]|uniref:hypothetical protein n=1 Tax=Oscillatoria sp. CS-180 TaxID=3021720 RepID=UPI00232BB310|nr:hypothetical protein [Oscillatoria sp. CS-180]MDB9524577.1 hypothetical protein [Oscillatoria sp. CS-180]